MNTPMPSDPVPTRPLRSIQRRLLSVLTSTSLLLAAPTVWASLDAAMKAWAAGDYNAAAKILKPKADEGDAEAQFNLGLYYFQGLSGSRNYNEAARLFSAAAEQGHVMAANNLGAMYLEGRGIPASPTDAWFWFATVAQRGDAAGGVLRDLAASKMSPVQVEIARKRFEAWVEKNDTPWWKKLFR
jgi:TPR repeat protein